MHFVALWPLSDKKGGVAQIGEEYSMNITHPYSHQCQQPIISEGVFKIVFLLVFSFSLSIFYLDKAERYWIDKSSILNDANK